MCEAGSAGTALNGACESCVAGQYRNATMSAERCLNCPAGYASDVGSTKCRKCDAGMFKGEVGKDCQNCDPGQYRTTNDVDSTTCIACPSGFSQQQAGQTPCLPCLPGEYQNETRGKLHAFHVHATRKVLNHTRQRAILVKKVKSLKKEVLNV